ncbi:serine hydrolase [Methylobacterium fujisawaense]
MSDDCIKAPDDCAAALERLFRETPVRSDWFTAGFLAGASVAAVTSIVVKLIDRYGPCQQTTKINDGWVLRLRDAEVPVRCALDGHGRFAGLLFQPAVRMTGSIEDHVRAIAALPERSAVLVATDGRTRFEHGSTIPLAVGSAFKLAVLHAVAMACEGGRLSWDRVVPLDPAWRSLPSGVLQDWPEGTPLTIAALANFMISVSDNTATDALIHLVGRANVESISARNTPFLTTREAFILKRGNNDSLRRDWLTTEASGKRVLLERLAEMPLPFPDQLAREVTTEVEWFFTAEEIRALLEATHHLPPFRISAGMVPGRRWSSVAYKGGSENGVLNLSALVVAESGQHHCVVATWNDAEALNPERLLEPFRGILRILEDDG